MDYPPPVQFLLYKSLFVTSHYASDWWLLGGKTN